MKKLLICLLFISMAIGCSSNSNVVIKDSDRLKYGTRVSVIERAWGKPDEAMSFQDYMAYGFTSDSIAGGSWGPYNGSASGYPLATTFTSTFSCNYFMYCLETASAPTTIVWIYKEKERALFFQQRALLGEPYKYSPITILSWKLVGWENLR
jgi:hypothetical protein